MLRRWFSTILSHVIYKPITKFSGTPKNIIFDSFTLMAIVVLAGIIFLFYNLREKRPVPLTK